MTLFLRRRVKAIIAILGGGLTVAASFYTTGTLGHVLAIALAMVTAAGVYWARNKPMPVPESAAHLADTPVARAAMRAAVRGKHGA